MRVKEIMFDDSISNRDKFGVFLREERKKLGMTIREFANILNLTPAYILDIEKGNRHAPLKYLDSLVEVLNIAEEELVYFYDIAACSYSNWPEINEYLSDKPNARKFIRLAMSKGLSGEEFLELVNKLIKSKGESQTLELLN